jgi:hypothetical protein
MSTTASRGRSVDPAGGRPRLGTAWTSGWSRCCRASGDWHPAGRPSKRGGRRQETLLTSEGPTRAIGCSMPQRGRAGQGRPPHGRSHVPAPPRWRLVGDLRQVVQPTARWPGWSRSGLGTRRPPGRPVGDRHVATVALVMPLLRTRTSSGAGQGQTSRACHGQPQPGRAARPRGPAGQRLGLLGNGRWGGGGSWHRPTAHKRKRPRRSKRYDARTARSQAPAPNTGPAVGSHVRLVPGRGARWMR